MPNTDVMADLFEELDDGGAVAVLEDAFVAFGAEFEEVGGGPFRAAVAAEMSADGLETHFGLRNDKD
jgi:hypothetical protein